VIDDWLPFYPLVAHLVPRDELSVQEIKNGNNSLKSSFRRREERQGLRARCGTEGGNEEEKWWSAPKRLGRGREFRLGFSVARKADKDCTASCWRSVLYSLTSIFILEL
jgi:hypothetical protein